MRLLRMMVKQIAIATVVIVSQRIAAAIIDRVEARLQRKRVPQLPSPPDPA